MFENLGGRKRSAPQRLAFVNVSVPCTKVGAIASFGLVVIAWFAISVARPFIIGTIGLGVVVGFILQWKHSRE